jgi:divalent metal cation (Fe/Co/Zn/Cd) transporter
VGSFVGILGARLGFPILDPIASVVICLFVLKAAYDIFADAVQKMTDTACDDATQAAIRDVVLQQSGVLGIDQLKTRLFGNRIYVDLEILADGNKTLLETHDTAQQVHDVIEGTFPNVKHCMVHVNPKE